MFAHKHLSNELSDYVLDLLAPEERRRIDRHLRDCTGCRERLQQERMLLRDVRHTLQAATQPSTARLNELMPSLPAPRSRKRLESLLRPALALGILLMLFVASLQLYGPNGMGEPVYYTPTTVAATATLTPTTTAQPLPDETVSAGNEVYVRAPSRPIGTPVAALLGVVHN